MRTCIMMLCAAGLLSAAPAPKDAVKKELEKLQGTWIMESCIFNGMELVTDQNKGIEMVIKDESYKLGDEIKGTFKIDPAKKLKTVDRTDGSVMDKGKVYLGIYELDGDKLKVCSSASDKVRPKEFSGDKASEAEKDDEANTRELMVFKRKK